MMPTIRKSFINVVFPQGMAVWNRQGYQATPTAAVVKERKAREREERQSRREKELAESGISQDFCRSSLCRDGTTRKTQISLRQKDGNVVVFF